ncbi:hypothetical protein O3M35_007292 [Rhynocoris fuscipes]|uniref:Uncharacterized protein n=1 Tax=Rhynocoris fuscipes TaxID=488301 RepID=A0AAW1D8X9_9HEMI
MGNPQEEIQQKSSEKEVINLFLEILNSATRDQSNTTDSITTSSPNNNAEEKSDKTETSTINLPPCVEEDSGEQLEKVRTPELKNSMEFMNLTRTCNLRMLLAESDVNDEDHTTLNTELGYETPSLMSIDNISTSPIIEERSEDERELMIGDQPLYATYYNSVYNEEDREWARFRVEMFTRDLCIIYCVLAQMLLNEDEIGGNREVVPTAEEARQILLMMTTGNHWDVLNLCMILNLSDKINKMTKYGHNFTIFKSMSREFMENSMRSCLDIWEREVGVHDS